MSKHSRRKKPIPLPEGGSKYVHGVAFHKASRRYRIQYRQNGKVRSEYFPKTARGLALAKRRRAEIDRMPTRLVPEPFEQATDRLVSLGIDTETPDAHPEILERDRRRQINPRRRPAMPKADRHETPATGVSKTNPTVYDRLQPVHRCDNPGGQRLTIAEVGEFYRALYVRERCDIQDAKHKADTANASGRAKKNRNGYTWLDFVTPSVRKYHNEHERYYAEFVEFVGPDAHVDELTGGIFRDYRYHVQQIAKRKASQQKNPITNPGTWANKRYAAVIAAMRRAKRRYPEAAWAKGLFGDDGLLKILEAKRAIVHGKHVPVTPREFRKMLDVADTQWRALLMLGLNCALRNSDMMIPWSAIDWDNKLMKYPRPRTGHKRITPLAEETIAALKEWRAESKSERDEIFITWHGTPWQGSTDSIGKHWDILRDRVEQETGHRIPATFTGLRKTPGPLILAADVPNANPAVQYLLGQKPNDSWRHYVDVAPDCLYAAVEVIRKHFFIKL